MNELVVSLIRTYVPLLVGSGLIWLANQLGIGDLDVTGAQSVAVSIVVGLYYLGARLLERRWPEAGVLLGHRTQPTYGPPPVE